MTKKGIDVSEHQGKINWDNVKTDFAILRAGYARKSIFKNLTSMVS